MGSVQSTKGYARLRSDMSSLTQPLLGNVDELVEQQEHEFAKNQKKIVALEKEVRYLKSKASKFEPKAIKVPKPDSTLEKEVKELKLRVSKFESLLQVHPEVERLKEKIVAMEDKIEWLTMLVDRMQTGRPESKMEDLSINDIVACLVVLIFMISILIGINL